MKNFAENVDVCLFKGSQSDSAGRPDFWEKFRDQNLPYSQWCAGTTADNYTSGRLENYVPEGSIATVENIKYSFKDFSQWLLA